MSKWCCCCPLPLCQKRCFASIERKGRLFSESEAIFTPSKDDRPSASPDLGEERTRVARRARVRLRLDEEGGRRACGPPRGQPLQIMTTDPVLWAWAATTDHLPTLPARRPLPALLVRAEKEIAELRPSASVPVHVSTVVSWDWELEGSELQGATTRSIDGLSR